MAMYTWSSVQNFDNWWFWIRKKNTMLNLIKEQDYYDVIDKIYLYARDLTDSRDSKYQFLIKNVKMQE